MTSATQRADAAVERLDVSAYTVATDRPESDGTLEWDSTTLVLVEAHAGGEVGVGYTYADVAAARLIESKLVDAVEGCDAMAVPAAWAAMVGAIRNLAVVATPCDFTKLGPMGSLLMEGRLDADDLIDDTGNVPAQTILQEQAPTYNERFSLTLTTFDGDTVTIDNASSCSTS